MKVLCSQSRAINIAEIPPPFRVQLDLSWALFPHTSPSPPSLPSPGDPRHDLVEDEEKEGVRNYLVIHDADEEDFGAYNCSVVNEYGVAQMLIRLKQESEWPDLLITTTIWSTLHVDPTNLHIVSIIKIAVLERENI